MELKTLFGSEANDIYNSNKKYAGIILMNKFNGLVKKYNLELYKEKDGLLIASDDSGQILYKKIKDFEWFQWKPYNIKETAERIFNLQ